MTLIGLGLSGFTRRLSIQDFELPFSSNSSARRRGNASISLPSSSTQSVPTHPTTPSSWFNRPSLTPLLGKQYRDEHDKEEEGKYDFFMETKGHRRSSSSFSFSNLSYQSRTYLIALLYLFLFGLVLVTYMAQNGIQGTAHARETLAKLQQTLGVRDASTPSSPVERQKGGVRTKMVWSDDGRYNTTLPKPFDGYRWTFLHANFMPGEDASNGTTLEKLEMLTFIEAVPPKRQIGWWQLTLPPIPEVISSATCRFSNSLGDTVTPASMEWDFPRAPFQEKRARWALLISCDVPSGHTSSAGGSTLSSLDLLLADEKTTFTQTINLKPEIIPERPKDGSLGICVSPLYGPLNEMKLLEWRLHHLKLGVQVVHWYDRDGRGRTKEWVKELKRLYRVHDTFTDAPCISPETCGTGILEDKGVSGDQVLYYADCLARSRHSHPTEWLAMIDIDEFIFPSLESNQNVTLSSFLSSQEPTIAALAVERFMAPSDPVLPDTITSNAGTAIDGHTRPPTLMLDKIESLLTPQEIDRHDNTKMIYRASALKLAWVHWEVSFRSDQSAHLKKKIEKLDDGIMLVHVNGSKGRGPFKTPLLVKGRLKEHVESVREGCRDIIARLPWLAS